MQSWISITQSFVHQPPKQSDGVKCRPGRVTLQQRPTPLNYQSSSLASVHPQLNLGHVQVPSVNKDIA